MPRNLPGTRALRTFEAAARHLNFTRAAEEVGLTPAAVSHQIKDIEQQLGVTLFVRNSRSIALTAAGAELHRAAIEALATLQRALGRARRLDRDDRSLRLSLSARVASNWLLPRLPRFKAAHPQWALSFDISDELRDFDADGIDLAIRFGRGGDAGLRSERLFGLNIVAVCSPALRDAGAPLREPRDLLARGACLSHVSWRSGSMVWPDWRQWMAAAGLDDFDDRACMAFADASHVVQAALDGHAVGLAELELIGADLAQGRLVRLFDHIVLPLAPDYAYRVVHPLSRDDDARVVALRDWLLEEARNPDPTAGAAAARDAAD
ncbi:LysR family transcriptional regulator, glycine cleavage system transcriptional activator [Lysobacter sp. yr284]|uniref:LysR substrate-binding domain-containing protein n=1 Tax=Lysobacter TaxID=68 RepID=UPI00089A8363|nr:LysR substrate-binding domain-containing protein [Lysobacter sp. yr284]SDY95356.1 LysR family transcriptional regulator, glycine cleavage system transcriptional activator [Lysobacter sp. yr284]